MPDQDKPETVIGVAETLDDVTATAEDRRRVQMDEYGTYVATSAITHDGVRAYNIGDPVPVSNVQRWKYDELGLVAKRSTKAGAGAVEAVAKAADAKP